MFTKADYLNYVHDLSEKEREILFGLHRVLEQASDETLVAQLAGLLREKQAAYEAVVRLFGRLFDLAAEQRRYRRDPALGDVKLRNLDNGEMIRCRCLDISLGGVCVQGAAELPQGLRLALEVRFFGSRRPVMRRGSVRWCSRAGGGLYRAGIEFETESAVHTGQAIGDDG